MTVSPATFRVVARFDPAIDFERTTREAAAEYRESYDIGKLVFRDSDLPSIFYCRRLKVSEVQAAKHFTGDDVYVACFARGLMSVDNLRNEDGTQKNWTRPDADRPLTTREIDAAFDAGEVLEIGAAIYGRSILGKGRLAAWPLPDTSRLAVEGLALRRVADMRRTDASSPPNKSEAEELPPTTEGG